ncbi:cytochrome b [Hyphomonas sp.]|uniref:cytochrome b n=1 Tax=Hyphomonas sp. TaxID=87 RepID=UPI0039190FBB
MTDHSQSVYGGVSRANHWIGALLFAGVLSVGFYLAYSGIEGPDRRSLMGMHRATGTVLLLFALWRVIWRLRQGFPSPLDGVPAWQVIFARITHWGLIACMLAMPLSGVFMMSLLGGRGIDIYGLFTIPPILEIEGIRPIGRQVHGIVAFTFVGLIGLHILGALKHLLIDRDGTVQRMLAGGRR